MMPTNSRRENIFIERFLSAYENYSWADATIDWVDEKIDGAVEAIATRKSDGKTLAVEHTIVEPFLKEKEDFAFFERAFLKIEKDTDLPVPGRWIQVFIPFGALRGYPRQEAQDAIVDGVHEWLRTNRLLLPFDFSEHPASFPISRKKPFKTTIYTRVTNLPGAGRVHVRRQQMDNNLGDVVEKALKKKPPKLVQTRVDKRILILERQHMNLLATQMLGELNKRKVKFPELASIDEIWILETMFYEREGYLRFELFDDHGSLAASLDFKGDELLDTVANRIMVPGPAANRK